MGKMIKDNAKRGLQASVEGFANEHIAAGILMKKYQNVSLVDLPLSPYDIVIVLKKQEKEDIIRVQVKTSKKSISFTGGTRGGVDRTYKSDIKTYVQSTNTSDVIVGICPRKGNEATEFDLYFVPTFMVEVLGQSSISIKKVQMLKNNYEILERCKEKNFVLAKVKEYKLTKRI